MKIPNVKSVYRLDTDDHEYEVTYDDPDCVDAIKITDISLPGGNEHRDTIYLDLNDAKSLIELLKLIIEEHS